MSDEKPILWLASWYPNKFGPFDGDFIQRHAVAVSRLRPVEVLFVKKGLSSQMSQRVEMETSTRSGLTETIGYYKPMITGFAALDRLLSFLQYLWCYRKLINAFMLREGRPEFVHVHVTMRAGMLALWLKRKYRVPYLVTEHWTGFSTQAEDNFYQQHWLFRVVATAILRNADTILPVCHYLSDQIKKIAQDRRYQVIENVVDAYLFQQGLGNNKPVSFFHASSLTRQKNPEAILRAFASIGVARLDWQLVIAGPVSDALRYLGQQLGIDHNITWLGEVSYPAVAQEMKRSDVLVMFSRFENLPCVIAEALCCGLRVISNRMGGIPEMLDDTNGILVDTEEQLAAAISAIIISGAYQNRQEIAHAALSRYNYGKVARDFEVEYDRIRT